MTIVFPNSLPIGFQTSVINAGTGTITLNASVLYSTDASVKLSDKYAGATAIHKGSGRWYAFGNLK
jgi:hypothetical protein